MDEAWYGDLSVTQKVAFEYIWAKADCAGVWSVNKKLAEAHLGEKLDWPALVAACAGRVVELDAERVLLRDFVAVNYANLSAECKAHIPVFKAMEKHRIELVDSYAIAIRTVPRKDPDKDKEKDTDSSGKGMQGETKTPTLEEVIAYGASPNASVPANVCEAWWNEHEQRPRHVSGAYTDKQGTMVFDWKAALRGYASKWRNNDALRNQPRGNGKPAVPHNQKSQWGI